MNIQYPKPIVKTLDLAELVSSAAELSLVRTEVRWQSIAAAVPVRESPGYSLSFHRQIDLEFLAEHI